MILWKTETLYHCYLKPVYSVFCICLEFFLDTIFDIHDVIETCDNKLKERYFFSVIHTQIIPQTRPGGFFNAR